MLVSTILLFIILFFLSAFFSGTELALMSLADHKIEVLFKKGKFGSSSLKQIKKNNDRLLITILIGNNLVNVYTAALATTIAIGLAEKAGLAQSTAIGITTGIVTILLLLFGEIIPKSIATKNASTVSLLVAPIYKVLMFILYPVILIIERIILVFTPKTSIVKITGEEIESFIDLGKKSGGLEEREHKKIKSILDFDDTTVEEIMTPRVKIEALSSDTKLKDALSFYLSHTHSRIPIYTKTIDNIDRFINSRDILCEIKKGNSKKLLSEIDLQKVMRVPLNQPISTLFEKLQKAHRVMAIVIDEYGGVSGLITMEDVVEEVFGEIRDETDKETDDIKNTGKDLYLVEPDILMEDILDKFSLEISNIGLDEKEFDGETLSYIITHIIEGFPHVGEIVSFKIKKKADSVFSKIDFRILDIDDHKMGKIEVSGIKKNRNKTKISK